MVANRSACPAGNPSDTDSTPRQPAAQPRITGRSRRGWSPTRDVQRIGACPTVLRCSRTASRSRSPRPACGRRCSPPAALARSRLGRRPGTRCRLHLRHALAGMTCIAAYLPLPTEPLDAGALDLLAGGARVLVPVVTGAAPLDWCEYARPITRQPPSRPGAARSASTSRPGRGSARPPSPTPTPSWSRRWPSTGGGHRLGRGGGHYDRTLALLVPAARPEPLPTRIALIYDDELLPSRPVRRVGPAR